MDDGIGVGRRAGLVAGGVLVLVAAAGLVAAAIGGEVALLDDGQLGVIVRKLQLMAVIALLIERAVEVYLVVTRQNGPVAYAPPRAGQAAKLSNDDTTESARRVATGASLTLAFVLALCGLRAIGPSLEVAPGVARWLIDAVDVFISAGLMAGGAAVIHEIIEWIREFIGLGRLTNAANLAAARGRLQLAEAQNAAEETER